MSYKVYRRAYNGTSWTDITANCNIGSLSFDSSLKDRLNFSFECFDRLSMSDSKLVLEDGDLIAITNDSDRYNIVLDRLVGKVDADKTIVGADYANFSSKPWRELISITCNQLDFSDFKLRSFNYTDTALSDVLDDILSNSSEILGGVINSVNISKYSLKISDYNIKSFEIGQTTIKGAFDRLIEDQGLYYYVKWYCEPDGTNTLNIAAELVIFDKKGLIPAHYSWSGSGITDEVIKLGKVTNTDYVNNSYQPQYFECCEDIRTTADKDVIRNIIKLDVNTVYNAGSLEDDLSSLERTTFKSDGSFTYTLPYPAYDIKYVGYSIPSYVTSEGSQTTTSFYVPEYDADSMSSGDVIRVIDATDGTINYRTIDSVSGNQITVTESMTFTPATNDYVEVINQSFITIYEDNQVTYASNGVVKDVSPDRNAKIRFLPLAEPSPGIEVVVHYYRIQPYKDQPFNQQSINRYGPLSYDVKLDGIYTRDQVKLIAEDLMILEPAKTVEFNTYRPINVGEMIAVDIDNFYSGNLIVQTVSGEYLGTKKSFNYWRYSVTLSDVRDDLQDIIRRIEANSLPVSKTGPDNNRSYQVVPVNTSVLFSIVKSESIITNKDFDISSFTDGVYYNFQTGSGTVLYDQLGATTTNANLGDSSLWTTGYQGYYGYGGIDSLAKRILIPQSVTYSDSGNTRGFVYLFKTGSDVTGSRYLSSKDATVPLGANEHQIGFNASGQLDILIYGGLSTFFVWRSTNTGLLSTNSVYLVTIGIDLNSSSLTATINGSIVSGSIVAGSIVTMPSLKSTSASSYIGLLYQPGTGALVGISDFTFYRLLFTTDTISSAWAATEATRFGL